MIDLRFVLNFMKVVLAMMILILVIKSFSNPYYSVNRRNYNEIKKYADNMYIVDENDTLFMNGNNRNGHVAQSNEAEFIKEPVAVMKNVDYVYDGNESTFVIDKNGDLWAWGSNYYFQLGTFVSQYVSEPTKVMEDVADVINMDSTTYLIDKNGSLFCWGSNKYGQFGGGKKDKPIMENVKYVTSYKYATYVIKEDNSLWGWGWNEYSQMAVKGDKHIIKPTKILDNIAFIKTNSETVYAVDLDGALWSWGKNQNGEVANGTQKNNVYIPEKVLDNVADVYIGHYVVYALKKDGTLWSWGRENLGYNGSQKTPVKILDNIQSVHIKNRAFESTPDVSHAIDKDGNLWSWGRNVYGEAGVPNIENVKVPVKILEDVKNVYSGYGSSFGYKDSLGQTYVLKNDNSLWSWECEDEDNSEINFVKIIDNVKEVTMTGLTPQILLNDGSLWLYEAVGTDEYFIENDSKEKVLKSILEGVNVSYAVNGIEYDFSSLDPYNIHEARNETIRVVVLLTIIFSFLSIWLWDLIKGVKAKKWLTTWEDYLEFKKKLDWKDYFKVLIYYLGPLILVTLILNCRVASNDNILSIFMFSFLVLFLNCTSFINNYRKKINGFLYGLILSSYILFVVVIIYNMVIGMLVAMGS